MIYPDFIKNNDILGITAPSDGNKTEVDYARLNNGIKKLEEFGYKVIETSNVRTSEDGRSASGKIRAKEFMKLVNNPDVKWIISAKGGDYLLEILPLLDFARIKSSPKWFQGFSDNTGLTYVITTLCDIASIYGNNFNDFGMSNWHDCVKNNLRILEGKNIVQYSYNKYQDGFYERITGLEDYVLTEPVYWHNVNTKEEIIIKGRALGGCLDVLRSFVGTRFDQTNSFVEKYKEDGILWYLESFALNAESLTLALWQLKEAGWFRYAKGFVFGRPTFYDNDKNGSYEEVVTSVIGDLNLPIILDGDIGHKPPQLTMINGAFATIKSKSGKAELIYEFI